VADGGRVSESETNKANLPHHGTSYYYSNNRGLKVGFRMNNVVQYQGSEIAESIMTSSLSQLWQQTST